jgi:virginiamycin B lyase
LGGTILGLALGVSLASHGAPPGAEVSELKVTIREWDVPTKGAHPHDPAVGPDGALWFTEQMANKLGRLDPATGTFKEYSLVEGKNSGPHGLVADKDGNIWYTANFGGYIGELDPRTGKVTEYKMPDESVDDPHTAVFDARGILWFTAQGGNAVGRLDPRTGKIELKKVQTESAQPYGIQINGKGVPFFFANSARTKWARSTPRRWESRNTNCQREQRRAGWRSRLTIRSISRTSRVGIWACSIPLPAS